jgi:hypothetical protein
MKGLLAKNRSLPVFIQNLPQFIKLMLRHIPHAIHRAQFRTHNPIKALLSFREQIQLIPYRYPHSHE